MKAYVKIQSSVTINVTAGLQYGDETNEDAHIPDRLKVSPEWPKTSFMIQAGQHWYPSIITSWPSVRALEKDGILTIGEESDNADGVVESAKEELEHNMEEVEQRTRRKRRNSLDEVLEG